MLVLGTNIAVLLDCLKSSRRCSIPYLLTYWSWGRFIIASTPCFCVGIGDQHSGTVRSRLDSVAFLTIAGRRYTYTVCTYWPSLP